MVARRHAGRLTTLAVSALLMTSACGGGGSGSSTSTVVTTTPTESPSSTAPTEPETMPSDAYGLMAVLGPPDIFRRELRTLDDAGVLVESYTYAEVAQRFDLVDGLVVGNEAIEALPEDSLLPLQYAISELWPGSTRADLQSQLEHVEFTAIDAEALDLPTGAVVLAAPQLVVGVLDDVVVYVETFALVPDPNGEFTTYLEGGAP